MKKLIILSLLVFGCYASQYERTTDKPIDVFYEKLPDREFTEIKKVYIEYKEYGVLTGNIEPEYLLNGLKDKAAKLDADAIINVEIDSERSEYWKGSATAIKYEN